MRRRPVVHSTCKTGARCVGIDLSERQLDHARNALSAAGLQFPLINAGAEHTPFADGSFDVVFCDHGAMTYARPERTVAEASRLLRPGGLFAFNMTSPLLELCWDSESDTVTTSLSRDYFGLREIEDDAISYQLPHGEWIRLFRKNSFIVKDLIEIQPPQGAPTSYDEYVSVD